MFPNTAPLHPRKQPGWPALPFMQALHQQTVVIVYAAPVVLPPRSRLSFSQEVPLLAQTSIRPVVVHGGLLQSRSPRSPACPNRSALPARTAA